MSEFEKQLGSELSEPQTYDIGWYLSAMLEDPLADELLKKAISDYFDGKDYRATNFDKQLKSLHTRTLELESRIESLKKTLQERNDLLWMMQSANSRLSQKNLKLQKMYPVMGLLVSVASTVTTYFFVR